MSGLKTRLGVQGPLLFDGAMGTCFASRPGRAGERCELASLTCPEEISAIHRAYLDAGCQALKTNTFTAGADLAEGRETYRKLGAVREECRKSKRNPLPEEIP